MNYKKIIYFLLIVFSMHLYCDDETEIADVENRKEQIKKGNLALPSSQQPGPLFSFGQNVIDKNSFQVFGIVDYLQGKCSGRKYNDVIPALLYAFNNHCSLYVAAPFATQSTFFDGQQNGIENIQVQIEFDLYNNDKEKASDEITFVGAVLIPAGSPFSNPATGFTAPSFFLGTTASHMAVEWYFFVAAGALLTAPRNKTKFGDVLLYDCGIGRNIHGNPDDYILTAILEINGFYDGPDIINGVLDCNSGNNTIYVGPSLWFSTKKLILQAGIEFPIVEQLRGIQPQKQYLATLTVGWKFN